MDIKEIIESGSLELYVIGALPPDEMRQLDKLRLEHPELDTEIRRIEEALHGLASSLAVQPQKELKEQIARKIKFDVELDLSAEKIGSVTIQMPFLVKFASAAAVLIIFGMGLALYYTTSNYHNALKQAEDLKAKNDVLANKVKAADLKTDEVKTQLAVLTDATVQHIKLAGEPVAPSAVASIYWNKQTGQTYLNASGMPVTEKQKQYQLWAIVQGKPVSLGVIENVSSFVQMQDVKDAQAFAITLEPLGGSQTPTMPIYVKGAV